MLLSASVLASLSGSCAGQGVSRSSPQVAPGSVRIQRTLEAHASTIFRAWSDPNFITQWFPYHADVRWRSAPAVQARVGGHFLWTLVGKDDKCEIFSFHGVYRELKPAKRLVFTWNWDTLPFPGIEAPGSTLVTVELVSQGQGTLLTLTQTGFITDVSRNAHEKGWNRCLDGMEFVLRSEQ